MGEKQLPVVRVYLLRDWVLLLPIIESGFLLDSWLTSEVHPGSPLALPPSSLPGGSVFFDHAEPPRPH